MGQKMGQQKMKNDYLTIVEAWEKAPTMVKVTASAYMVPLLSLLKQIIEKMEGESIGN